MRFLKLLGAALVILLLGWAVLLVGLWFALGVVQGLFA